MRNVLPAAASSRASEATLRRRAGEARAAWQRAHRQLACGTPPSCAVPSTTATTRAGGAARAGDAASQRAARPRLARKPLTDHLLHRLGELIDLVERGVDVGRD